jgi:hypothetical protein
VRTIFDAPTLAALADAVQATSEQFFEDIDEVTKLLEYVEHLSDDDLTDHLDEFDA